MMTALLLHGYTSGIYSSRWIARATVERADFMMIVAGDPPEFRTISEFRRRHLKALAELFVQVLKLAGKAGLVKLGHVALDGTKIKANASKHKAMSYDRMKKREAELEAEVARWLKAAEAADAEEDKLYGDKRGDEMPDWVADKEKRLQKIREAKAALEAEARAAAEAEIQARAEAEGRRQAEGRKKTGGPPAPLKAEPGGKAQRNFTDPESPHPEDQGRLHPGLQRTGCGRRRPSGHRGADADQQLQRSDATGAAAQCNQDQSREEPRRGVGRCRLLLGCQPSHDQTAAHRGLHRHRKTETWHQVRYGKEDHPRLADRQDEHQARACRLSKPLPIAKADRRAGVRTNQTVKRVQAIPVARH
jgi:hypothetical protein